MRPLLAPPLRLSGRDHGPARVTVLQAAALALPLLAALVTEGGALLPLAAGAAAVTLFWELVFALLRHRAVTWHGLTTAMIFTVMADPGIDLWQAAVALSLGTVLAELVFGGRGFGFVNAGAASLAMLVFSFPQAALAPHAALVAFATLPGAVLLIGTGLLSWQVLAGLALVVAGLGPVLGAAGPEAAFTALAFAAVFLIADPLATAATPLGRWATGVLAGLLLLALSPALAPAPVVFAALLTSIFAPLIEVLTVRLHIWRRTRHG